MANITRLASGIAWRQHFRVAKFRDAVFHVETGVRESARRIVAHEFPKRDIPYAEDMGRRAREFTVRGYIVAYPRDDVGPGLELKRRDYRPARDNLIRALEEDGPAELQLPLLYSMKVACTRYRVTEEKRAGGYCMFDMSFVEYGQAPAEGTRQSAAGVSAAADQLTNATTGRTQEGIKKADEVSV